MNIDKNICNRAWDKAGEEPITEAEWTEGTGTRVRLIKDIYLATILEALSDFDWTCQIKRAVLSLNEENQNLTNYRYMYNLPLDCAKPCSLLDESIYLVEGKYLYTDSENAILVYVSNNFTGTYKYSVAETQPASQEELAAGTYYTYNAETDTYTQATTWAESVTYYVRNEEDYYFYDDFNFDAPLTKYIVCLLAQNIVLKLTGDANKYQLLWSEAQVVKDQAYKTSVAHAHNKDKGNPYWGDMLGLPNYGGN